jgi:hypothetical protein
MLFHYTLLSRYQFCPNIAIWSHYQCCSCHLKSLEWQFMHAYIMFMISGVEMVCLNCKQIPSYIISLVLIRYGSLQKMNIMTWDICKRMVNFIIFLLQLIIANPLRLCQNRWCVYRLQKYSSS